MSPTILQVIRAKTQRRQRYKEEKKKSDLPHDWWARRAAGIMPAKEFTIMARKQYSIQFQAEGADPRLGEAAAPV